MDWTSDQWLKQSKVLRYFERGGRLWFSYEERILELNTEHRERWKRYKTEGEIPEDIVSQGEDAIQRYTEERISVYLTGAKEADARHEDYASNLNFPVSFTHQGVLLKGKIVSGLHSTLVVRLEEPYQGERAIHFGWASAMAGHYIFERGNLTQAAIEAAQRWMIYIYEEQKNYDENKEVMDLANRLNSSL